MATNGRKASAVSPSPTNLIGISSSSTIATSTPPFALESSLVTTTPVSCVASLKSFACEMAFCPVVPSTTRSVSAGRRADSRSIIAAHLLQFFHEVGLRLQAPGGVDENDVGVARVPALARRRRRRMPDRRLRRHGLPRPRCARPKSRVVRQQPRGTCRRPPATRAFRPCEAASRACRWSSFCRFR